MALAKHQIPHDSSNMGSKVQSCVFNEITGKNTAQGVNQYHKSLLEEEDGSQSANGLSNDSAITHSPPLCGSSNGYVYHKSTNYQLEEAESLIDFKNSGKTNLIQASGSLLSFQKEHCVWENDLQHQGYNQWNQILLGTQESVLRKRPSMGENMKAVKKHCSTEIKVVPKPKSSSSKDPQSVAAQNRRERISERLKILQELVPNGSKVDLVTMLEKAISYVKFLQLQVKVLATDEFWPVQGGKAPDISQVKEVIDAILSSQRDRSSSSN